MPASPEGHASSLGAGYLFLVARELTGLPQSALAPSMATSQPNIATLESGNRLPSVRTLLELAGAVDLQLVLGFRRPRAPRPDPEMLREQGFALLGTLHPNPRDDLADFVVLVEPTVFEGPVDHGRPARAADRRIYPSSAARNSSKSGATW